MRERVRCSGGEREVERERVEQKIQKSRTKLRITPTTKRLALPANLSTF